MSFHHLLRPHAAIQSAKSVCLLKVPWVSFLGAYCGWQHIKMQRQVAIKAEPMVLIANLRVYLVCWLLLSHKVHVGVTSCVFDFGPCYKFYRSCVSLHTVIIWSRSSLALYQQLDVVIFILIDAVFDVMCFILVLMCMYTCLVWAPRVCITGVCISLCDSCEDTWALLEYGIGLMGPARALCSDRNNFQKHASCKMVCPS